MNFHRTFALAPFLLLAAGCTFHSTATHWNGRVGPDGHPVFVKSATNVAINLLILLPFLGNTSMDEMVDDLTAEIAEAGGDHVRVVESSSVNYWDALAFPGITFFVTPVVSNLAVEYRPSPAEIESMAAEDAAFRARQRERFEQDHSHVVPDGR